MFEGSQSTTVELRASKLALQRATGSTVKQLADEYGISDAQMTQALEELGMIKKKEGEAKEVKKEKKSQYQIVAENKNLSVDDVKEIIVSCGYKLKEGRKATKKYTIINDLPKPE